MTRQLTTLNLDTFLKNAIGMHDMFDRIEHANAGNYPPYNVIALGNDLFRIELAVAGFLKEYINVTIENGELTVTGQGEESADLEDGEKYLHKGISSRSFYRSFTLAEHVEVTNATVENGILKINLQRIVPEALKPKQIEIK